MSLRLIIFAMLALGSDLFASEHTNNFVPYEMTNLWEYINYPFSTNTPTEPFFCVGSGAQWGLSQVQLGLRVDVFDIVQGDAFVKTNGITARLFRESGDIVEPTTEGRELLRSPIYLQTSSGPGQSAPQVMTFFPWDSNVLEECWVEVTVSPEHYWLEIPYGLDCCPTNPPAPSNTNGPPRFIPIKTLTKHDHILRWESVHYNLGETKDGRWLTLIQSNPFDAKSDVDLYDFPKTQTVYSPHTGVTIVDANNAPVTGRCVNIHLDDNYLRRTDTFALITRGFDDLRCWGQIEVSIDDQTNCVVIPSSLYKYTHGHIRLGNL